VRSDLPPILSIHGDKDDVVPYSQSVRLHDALEKAKVVNKLLTIKNGGHGQFPQADFVRSYEAIWSFLRQNRITN
jgi:dipeptidyl aminopeptidase/acylaminoacyl peptidase